MLADAGATCKEPSSHARQVERVLWIVFVLNLAVAAAKFFYGLASHSQSMQADGIHSVFDSFGNVVGLIGMALAARPADKSHPYGHAKFETYGSVVIGVLLILAAIEVGTGAVGKLTSGNYNADVTPISFVVMIGTLIINLCVTTYERRRGRMLRSEILCADAAHTMSDVFVSLGVVVGLILVQFGFPMADPVMALIVCVFILISAVNVFRSASTALSDHSRIPVEDIEAVAAKLPDIHGIHEIRTRGTEAEVYCDLHVLVDPDMTVFASHMLADQLEEMLKAAFPQIKEVLVHIEPYGFTD
jgi:cation diffusion facilitator family transporter